MDGLLISIDSEYYWMKLWNTRTNGLLRIYSIELFAMLLHKYVKPGKLYWWWAIGKYILGSGGPIRNNN